MRFFLLNSKKIITFAVAMIPMSNILYNKEYWQWAMGRSQSKLWDGFAYRLFALSRNTGFAGILHALNLFIIGLFCMRRTGLFAVVNANNLIT